MRKFLFFLAFVTASSFASVSEDFQSAILEYERKDYRVAEKEFSKINHSKWLPLAKNNQAVSQYNQGNLEGSILTWRTFLQTQHECRDSFNNLNAVYAQESAKSVAKLTQSKVPSKPRLTISRAPIESVALVDTEKKKQSIPKNKKLINASQATKNEAIPVKSNVQDAEREKILVAVQDWRNNWKKGDINEYLSAYFPKHSPKPNFKYAQWRADRKKKIWPGRISELKITNLKLKIAKDFETADIIFEQSYKSETVNDSVKKLLTMKKNNGRWLIYQEFVIGRPTQ